MSELRLTSKSTSLVDERELLFVTKEGDGYAAFEELVTSRNKSEIHDIILKIVKLFIDKIIFFLPVEKFVCGVILKEVDEFTTGGEGSDACCGFANSGGSALKTLQAVEIRLTRLESIFHSCR